MVRYVLVVVGLGRDTFACWRDAFREAGAYGARGYSVEVYEQRNGKVVRRLA